MNNGTEERSWLSSFVGHNAAVSHRRGELVSDFLLMELCVCVFVSVCLDGQDESHSGASRVLCQWRWIIDHFQKVVTTDGLNSCTDQEVSQQFVLSFKLRTLELRLHYPSLLEEYWLLCFITPCFHYAPDLRGSVEWALIYGMKLNMLMNQ